MSIAGGIGQCKDNHCRNDSDNESPQNGFPPVRGPDPDGSQRQTFAALAIRDSVIPPTINLENPDPECDLDYTALVAKKIRTAINNSFGFCGHSATLVLTEYTG